MRIFIIDDEEMACRGMKNMMERILGGEPNEIHTFTNSMEALEKVPLLCPDIILLDIVMPELNGIEFAERVKTVYATEIIMISGNDDYKYVRQSFKLNVTDYILKPVEFDELKNITLRIQDKLQRNKKTVKLMQEPCCLCLPP